MKKDFHKFDTSDYKADNPDSMPLVNKKVLGLMKEENNGKIMMEFVGLRAKLYTFEVIGDDGQEEDEKRAKEVTGSTLNTITFNDYKVCFLERDETVKTQNLIRSTKHVPHTVEQRKKASSRGDDKRMLRDDSTDTFP